MKNYIYKCVPVPSVIETGKKDLHSQAVSIYETIINETSSGGWELINIDTVSSTQKAGCLSGLFGGRGETVIFKLLVFKK